MLLCIVYAILVVNSIKIYSENYEDGFLCRCMQYATCFDSVDVPWVLQDLLFPHTSF